MNLTLTIYKILTLYLYMAVAHTTLHMSYNYSCGVKPELGIGPYGALWRSILFEM